MPTQMDSVTKQLNRYATVSRLLDSFGYCYNPENRNQSQTITLLGPEVNSQTGLQYLEIPRLESMPSSQTKQARIQETDTTQNSATQNSTERTSTEQTSREHAIARLMRVIALEHANIAEG